MNQKIVNDHFKFVYMLNLWDSLFRSWMFDGDQSGRSCHLCRSDFGP